VREKDSNVLTKTLRRRRRRRKKRVADGLAMATQANHSLIFGNRLKDIGID
jgi:hypothetical protein